jgi:predicted N-formylglutamate amidohydrolase
MNSPRPIGWLVTCEHGGNEVPARLQSLFASPGAKRDLASHRGFDIGAIEAANQFADSLATPLIFSTVTRLVVDLNRSLDHPQLLSKYSQIVRRSDDQLQMLLDLHYYPYRRRVTDAIQRHLQCSRRVIHLSIHTFTPRFQSVWRPIDVGLLFDPSHECEHQLTGQWGEGFRCLQPRLRIAMNQPYAGTDDGLTTALRTEFSERDYCGIEVEINHRFHKRNPARQTSIVGALLDSIPKYA